LSWLAVTALADIEVESGVHGAAVSGVVVVPHVVGVLALILTCWAAHCWAVVGISAATRNLRDDFAVVLLEWVAVDVAHVPEETSTRA